MDNVWWGCAVLCCKFLLTFTPPNTKLEEYGTVPVEKQMQADSILEYFNSLSMHMEVDAVLKRARAVSCEVWCHGDLRS